MADVVQSYSGGIQLDTIFIDEGFGSLDPESLDLAYRALADLRASGRLVGIISHVADLKEQCPVRVEVSSTPKGSTVKLVTG
jgi:exonuclease SbcC